MPQVTIKGASGRIEGRYYSAEQKGGPVALVLHGNPKRGGTMNSKLPYVLYQAFADMGFSVLRFNYRGVGFSEGEVSGGEGELNDALTCLNWLYARNVEPASCFVAGHSFGAYIGMQLLMRRPEVRRFISISPPTNFYDFSFLAPCPAPGLVIQGNQDQLVPREAVNRFVNRLNSQPSTHVTFKVLRNADHTFGGHLTDVFDTVQEYVKKNLVDREEVVRRKKSKHT